MNVAIMNFSGNVGKSTVARHLFLNRLSNAQLIPIESINSDGSEDQQSEAGVNTPVNIEVDIVSTDDPERSR